MSDVNTTQASESTNETTFWFDSFKEQVANLDKEVELFYQKGKKSAGGEARKILQAIRILAKDGRDHIQTTKQSLKKKA